MTYRADIDGLRAIAVLAVVAFHLGVPGFNGGFVGVDVFFVISGYLITSTIQQKYDAESFKLAQFYFRRIRRLLPALIVTVVGTVAAAGLVLTPYDLIAFARSAVAAIFSVSNIVFYMESGYWDTAAELKPLLHTWSLGVEEQFYLFWPALIMGLLTTRRVIPFAVSLALISALVAVLCAWYTTVDQSAAFYLLPFRVFQFSLGAMVIPLAAQFNARSVSSNGVPQYSLYLSGLILIGVGIFAIDEETLFPGWAVLIPTLGAMSLLLAGTSTNETPALVGFLLENPLAIWLGRISYSLYLVHWPPVALYRYYTGSELDAADQVGFAALTLLLAVALHYAVERRFYQRAGTLPAGGFRIPDSGFALRTFVIAGLVALAPISAWFGNGRSRRIPTLTLTPEEIRQGLSDRMSKVSGACKVTDPVNHPACDFDAPIQVLVFGNSHEGDGFNLINAGYGSNPELNLITFGNTNRCKGLRIKEDGMPTGDGDCRLRLNALFSTEFLSRLDVVLYAANKPFDENKDISLKVLKAMQARNPQLKIITLGGYINTKVACSRYVNEYRTVRACAWPEHVSYFEGKPEQEVLYGEFSKITAHYIDRVGLLCKNRILQSCLMRTKDGIPAFYDVHHHSLEFAEITGWRYAKKHPDLLRDLIQ